MQYVLKADVEDKKMLWEEGIVTPTPRYPQGRQPVAFMSAKLTFLQGRHVRVATIGVFCNHLAMCRVCGFADHNHNFCFCPKCKIPCDMLKSWAGLMQSTSHDTLVNKFLI